MLNKLDMKWLVALALFRTVLCAPHGHTADGKLEESQRL